MRAMISAIAALAMAACASPGPDVSDVPPGPIPQGYGRIAVSRSSDFLYLALPARTWLNGAQIASLSRNDLKAVDVLAGPVNLAVDTPTAPGRFSIGVTLEAGEERRFEVSPRGASFVPTLFGYGGAFVDTAINEQSGLFQIVPRP